MKHKNKIILTADKIAEKLEVLAKEKESTRQKLVVTAKQLAVTAREKESTRRKLVVTAKKLALTAKEKESTRQKLVVTAQELKKLYETLEKKVLSRTKDLEHIRSRQEAILASVGNGLVVVDKEGKIIYINKSFEEMLGWKAQEIIGKSMVEVVPREDVNGVGVSFKERILTQVLDGQKFVADLTNLFYYIRKDKTRFPVNSIVSPMVLDKKIVGAVEVFRDITKEKELEDLRWFRDQINSRVMPGEMDSADSAYDLIQRMRAALLELARLDINPKYLANGHCEVARKARKALGL